MRCGICDHAVLKVVECSKCGHDVCVSCATGTQVATQEISAAFFNLLKSKSVVFTCRFCLGRDQYRLDWGVDMFRPLVTSPLTTKEKEKAIKFAFGANTWLEWYTTGTEALNAILGEMASHSNIVFAVANYGAAGRFQSPRVMHLNDCGVFLRDDTAIRIIADSYSSPWAPILTIPLPYGPYENIFSHDPLTPEELKCL